MSNKVFIVALPEEVNNQSLIFGYPIIFSGVGKINASIAAYKAINDGFSEIINIGSCGSLNLEAGSIVKIGAVYQDIDCTPLYPYGTISNNTCKYITIDPNSKITCFTTDYFYDSLQKKKYSPHYLEMLQKCSIFDMELFALAQICSHHQITFTSYKWVSDNGSEHDWQLNCKVNFEKLKSILNV
jgi:adenosylhomocysteine nucleosidase